MNQARLDEIRRIVKSSHDLKSFYESFLTTIAQIANAQVGVAWDCTTSPYHPICQIQSKSAQPAKLAISEQKHLELLTRAVQNNRSVIVQPRIYEDEIESDQPLLMLGPVRRDSNIELVEFVLPNGKNSIDSKKVLQELDRFCDLASQFEAKTDSGISIQAVTAPLEPSRGFQPLTREALDQYAHAVHGSLDYKETARTIANETRRVLNCDRVSVAIKKGSKQRLLAISGQPSVNRRSNVVHLLSVLATTALGTGQPFWYPTDDQLPPQIEQPLNEYLAFSATRSLAILPIFDRRIQENNDPHETPKLPKVIAGLIVEHCNEQWHRAQVAPSIETASRHAADAMRNALGHRKLFGYWLWRLLGKSRVVTAARNLPRTLAVSAALVFLAVVLTVVPAPFTLHSEGVLLPQTRRKVFSEIDGKVSRIKVEHGSEVKTGDTLLSLTNKELDIRVEEIKGQIDGLEKRLTGNKISRVTNRQTPNEQLMLENTKAMKSEIESLKKQLAVLLAKSQKLEVTSPIDGAVITWDVSDRLRDRPVKAGDLLMEVADVAGEWEIELNLPDRRIGHLLRELEKQQSAGHQDGIEVTYQLAADPSSNFKGRIKLVSQATQLTADKKQGVRVVVEIDTDDVDSIRQARSGVSAKLHCGYEPLGYVWLHDVFEFFQSKVLFRAW